MQEDIELWKQWVAKYARGHSGVCEKKKDEQTTKRLERKTKKDDAVIWSPNMPYGC